jgi:hypothetical protein
LGWFEGRLIPTRPAGSAGIGSLCLLADFVDVLTDFLGLAFAFLLVAALALAGLTRRFFVFDFFFPLVLRDFFFAFRAMFVSFRNSRRRRHSDAAPAR